jgi:hypothetical protein
MLYAGRQMICVQIGAQDKIINVSQTNVFIALWTMESAIQVNTMLKEIIVRAIYKKFNEILKVAR